MRRREKKSDCTGSESGEGGQVPRYLGDGDGGMGCALGGPGMERLSCICYWLLPAGIRSTVLSHLWKHYTVPF